MLNSSWERPSLRCLLWSTRREETRLVLTTRRAELLMISDTRRPELSEGDWPSMSAITELSDNRRSMTTSDRESSPSLLEQGVSIPYTLTQLQRNVHLGSKLASSRAAGSQKTHLEVQRVVAVFAISLSVVNFRIFKNLSFLYFNSYYYIVIINW